MLGTEVCKGMCSSPWTYGSPPAPTQTDSHGGGAPAAPTATNTASDTQHACPIWADDYLDRFGIIRFGIIHSKKAQPSECPHRETGDRGAAASSRGQIFMYRNDPFIWRFSHGLHLCNPRTSRNLPIHLSCSQDPATFCPSACASLQHAPSPRRPIDHKYTHI